ncbi:molybdopterin-dependent oxidoreductase [Halobacteriaceae archaeon GCM10025711]
MTRFSLPPRLVDWTILAVVLFQVASGVVSFSAGRPSQRAVFVVHGMAGLTLVVLLAWKLWRVRRRLTGRWTRRTAFSALLAVVALGALGTGVAWVVGADVAVLAWNLLNLHVFLGLVLVPLVAVHLAYRWRTPTVRDVRQRRTVLALVGLAAFGSLAWSVQQAASALLGTPGADRRFTGSSEADSLSGNRFPATSWVADDPDPVDAADWSLRVHGAVERDLHLDYDDVLAAGAGERATLDCTSGWYSVQDWTGVRVGDLLDEAGATPAARWVQFRSVTGYRWSLPVAEARNALLATHVGEERLSHAHGFPVRLVAPGRRGFQWVKWVESVELAATRDASEYLAIFTSGFGDR